MNFSLIRNLIGKILVLVSGLMILPLIVSFIYKENIQNKIAFIIPITVICAIGLLLNIKKADNKKIGIKESFIVVSLSWLFMALCGCLPFILSGEIPNFFNALFEMTSGFTTTGASIVEDVTALSKSIAFWRSLSHWIGGMGVLVFILAIIPESREGSSLHILRAESPGPQVGKLVSRMKVSSRISYLIYIGLTVIEIIMLLCSSDMDLFTSIIYSMGTAGTGGFAIDATSLEFYSGYCQYVIASFMFLFGINFTLYYFMLIGSWREIFKNTEVKVYIGVTLVSIALIAINIIPICHNTEEAIRLSFFQVTSISSTTGFSTTNFDLWPSFSKFILLILMVFGACAGSTAGGLKISRVTILFKSAIRKIQNMISPRKVETIQMDGKTIDEQTVESVQGFFIVYLFVFAICALLISIDGHDVLTNFTASISCISNVGPGFSAVGPYGSFSSFSSFSKVVLTIEMIIGRLEIFPVLALFFPRTWRRN